METLGYLWEYNTLVWCRANILNDIWKYADSPNVSNANIAETHKEISYSFPP